IEVKKDAIGRILDPPQEFRESYDKFIKKIEFEFVNKSVLCFIKLKQKLTYKLEFDLPCGLNISIQIFPEYYIWLATIVSLILLAQGEIKQGYIFDGLR
ncbi:30041_t:CDS:2, partial [Gigaspora margarita]